MTIYLKRFVPIVLLLGAAITSLRADELQRFNHIYYGAAHVDSPVGEFEAAFINEDFDAGHTPELGYRALFRFYITPFKPVVIAASDTQETIRVWTTPDGHSVFDWNRWRIEVLPCEEIKRIENRGFASLAHGSGTNARVIAKQVRDTILIVVTVPL